VMQKFEIKPENILVVYDDFQIPFGTLRLRPHGTDGGHNGIASVIYHLETDEIHRLRIGVGGTTMPKQHSHESMADYVLSPFDPEEMELLPALFGHLTDACAAWLLLGIQRSMSRYNKDFFSSAGAE
nr:aminoacyl-tRNA hydrolase [Bacteroidota bacterium]